MGRTKDQLICDWQAVYPNDPDLEFNALAGHVRLKDGTYVTWDEYICMRRG